MNCSFDLLFLLFVICSLVHCTNAYKITGNLTVFDSIFASPLRKPIEIILDASNNHLLWTEGPVFRDRNALLFSDTMQNNIYSLDLSTLKHEVIETNSGDVLDQDRIWKAEPGSNGLALFGNSLPIIVCQHGARRLAVFDPQSKQRYALVTTTHQHFTHKQNQEKTEQNKRLKLNGPNDVLLRQEEDGSHYVYFTDPVYAWLEKDRFEDLPYLDERVKNDGPGFCGVYRARITTTNNNETTNYKVEEGDLELITSTMQRPNGIGFLQGTNTLVVSDCCQGNHLQDCHQGISRWNFFEQTTTDKTSGGGISWKLVRTIVDQVDSSSSQGCADGFETILVESKKNGKDHFLIASCAGGLCIVDVEREEVVARLWTTIGSQNEKSCKVSNVALGGNSIYITGNCGILKMALRSKLKENTEPEMYSVSAEL